MANNNKSNQSPVEGDGSFENDDVDATRDTRGGQGKRKARRNSDPSNSCLLYTSPSPRDS